MMRELLFILVAMAEPSAHGIPESLQRSIVWEESRGNPMARSGCNARGLFQVRMSSLCRGCRNTSAGAELLHVPTISKHMGTYILSRWMRRAERLEGCKRCAAAWLRALAGYNAGNIGLRLESTRANNYARRVWARANRRKR